MAELGYTALAVDMYGDGKQAATPDEGGKLSGEVLKNFDTVGAPRFMAALDFLKQQPSVDPSRIAAIGYCFGGSVVLNMAGQGADLRGVVSFHGGLGSVTPAQAGKVKAKVLVLTGAADNSVPPEQVETYKQQMKTAGADFRASKRQRILEVLRFQPSQSFVFLLWHPPESVKRWNARGLVPSEFDRWWSEPPHSQTPCESRCWDQPN